MKATILFARLALGGIMFLAGFGSAPTVRAQCLSQVVLAKSFNYNQAPCALPVPNPTRACTFVAEAAGWGVSGAILTAPGRPPVALAESHLADLPAGMTLFATDLFGENYYPNRAALELAWPSGDYVMSVDWLLTAGDFTLPWSDVLTISFTEPALPKPPMVLNLGAAQHLNPANEFRLEFEPFPGATDQDQIQIGIAAIAGLRMSGRRLCSAATPWRTRPWSANSLRRCGRKFRPSSASRSAPRSRRLSLSTAKSL